MCTCYQFPVALFQVSRQMHQEAIEVLCSENRFILSGDITENIAWLQALSPTALRNIRRLDILAGENQINGWVIGDYRAELNSLIMFIKDNLLISNLWLTIDFGNE